MNFKQSHIQTQKQILAPVLQQSVMILIQPINELNLTIDQELQNNPLLEKAEESTENLKSSEPFLNASHFKNLSESTSFQNDQEEEKENYQIQQSKSLEDHLMGQLRIEFNNPVLLKIGSLIIGNLTSDGFLATSIEEIALLAGTDQIQTVEKVRRRIQTFDPIGIGSLNVQECLSIQLENLNTPLKNLAIMVITNHFEELCKRKFDKIAKILKSHSETIKKVSELIASLEPKPARDYHNNTQTVYVTPDVYLTSKPEGELHIEINKSDTPVLRLNPKYVKLLESPRVTKEEKEFIQDRLNQALNFMKSIQMRGETLRQISEYIVEHQKDFLLGQTRNLSPMKLKDVAQHLNRNESTISRAINNKYMQTPVGLFPLRFFFTLAINDDNKDISSQNIKDELLQLVESEDKNNPLSDQDIINHFKSKGLTIARRTVNKYRLELDIPPSYRRKK